MGFNMKLDDVDHKIIDLLHDNPLMSHSEISRILGFSQPAISSRVKKIFQSKKYQMILGTDVLAQEELSLIKVEMKSTTPAEIMATTLHCPYIVNAMTINGESNLMLFMITRDLKHFHEFLETFVREHPHILTYRWEIVPKVAKPWFVVQESAVAEIPDERVKCALCGKCSGITQEIEAPTVSPTVDLIPSTTLLH